MQLHRYGGSSNYGLKDNIQAQYASQGQSAMAFVVLVTVPQDLTSKAQMSGKAARVSFSETKDDKWQCYNKRLRNDVSVNRLFKSNRSKERYCSFSSFVSNNRRLRV
jgi:hypothetical protein